jgi:predicted MFS family arabinose efflux permease
VLTDLLGWRWVLFVNVPVGIALFAVALRSLPESTGQSERRALDLAGAGSVTAGMAALVYGIERGASNPIVPSRTFRRRSLSVANALAIYFFVSLYLQQLRHYSPLQAELAFLPIGVFTLVGAMLAGRLVRRIGIR